MLSCTNISFDYFVLENLWIFNTSMKNKSNGQKTVIQSPTFDKSVKNGDIKSRQNDPKPAK